MRRPVHDLTQPGWVIVTAASVLCLIGLLCIHATEASQETFPWGTCKQGIYLAVSIAAAFLILCVGYQPISRHAYAWFAVILLLLILLAAAKVLHFDFGGLVPERRHAYRWISLPGFQLQPSEFMKVACVLALAWYLRFRKNYRAFPGMLVPFVLSGVPMVLILLEPDLGTVILMLPIPFVMLFAAGAKKRHLAIIIFCRIGIS